MHEPQESTNGQTQAEDGEPLSEEERLELANAELQQHFRDEYLRQLRQRSCPGYGENDLC